MTPKDVDVTEAAWCTRGNHEFVTWRRWSEKRQRWWKQSWCNACRREYHKIKAAGGTPPPSPRRHPVCVTCGADISDRYSNAKFCSEACRRAKMPERYWRGSWLRANYGITLDDEAAMMAAQNGVCAICGAAPLDGKLLDVDHCHTTHEVRGLLCPRCNRAIGAFDDDPELLEAAAAYLRR